MSANKRANQTIEKVAAWDTGVATCAANSSPFGE